MTSTHCTSISESLTRLCIALCALVWLASAPVAHAQSDQTIAAQDPKVLVNAVRNATTPAAQRTAFDKLAEYDLARLRLNLITSTSPSQLITLAEKDTNARIRETALSLALEVALEGAVGETSRTVIDARRKLIFDAVKKIIVTELSDADPRVRITALDTCARLFQGDATAPPTALTDRISLISRSDAEPRVRLRALEVLVRIAPPTVARQALQTATTDAEPRIAQRATALLLQVP